MIQVVVSLNTTIVILQDMFGSDDFESSLWERWNVWRSTSYRDRSCTSQGHGRTRAALNRLRTVPRKTRPAHWKGHLADHGRTFESHFRYGMNLPLNKSMSNEHISILLLEHSKQFSIWIRISHSQLGAETWSTRAQHTNISITGLVESARTWNRLRVRALAVSDTYPMFIEPSITSVPSGFSGPHSLIQKLGLKKNNVDHLNHIIIQSHQYSLRLMVRHKYIPNLWDFVLCSLFPLSEGSWLGGASRKCNHEEEFHSSHVVYLDSH